MPDLDLAGLLIIGLVASMGMSFRQHRYYSRTVAALIRDHPSRESVLTSGRCKGKLRGAVALIIVRAGADPVIERALTMEGASVFARFRERPELVGPFSAVAAMAPSVRRRAVEDAMANYRRLSGTGPPVAVPTAPRRARLRPAR